MKAKDYSDQVATFTPLEPQQMVRVALVGGIQPRYPESERQRYRRLLKEFTDIDEKRIDALFRLIGRESKSPKERAFLEGLLSDVAYDSAVWSAFDYEALKREGVVVGYSGDNRGLVQKVLEIDESKIIFVQNPIWEQADYVKHIDWRNKLAINGPDVIIQFAKDRSFELPPSFLEYRKLTEDVYRLLELHGFTYFEALRTAIKLLKDPKYAKRTISALVIKNPNGNELRLHPHDFVEAAELFVYALKHRKPIKKVLGDLLSREGNKYHGLNKSQVPKRVPENGVYFDNVETHYLPDFKDPRKKVLEWMHTVTMCDCGNALNLRNFEERRGRKTYVVQTFDTHVGVVVLEIQRRKGINVNLNPNNLNPLPTPEFLRFVDKLRYNLVQETEFTEGDKIKIDRRYVGEVGLEILINELAKLWALEQMWGPIQKISDFVLRPMY